MRNNLYDYLNKDELIPTMHKEHIVLCNLNTYIGIESSFFNIIYVIMTNN